MSKLWTILLLQMAIFVLEGTCNKMLDFPSRSNPLTGEIEPLTGNISVDGTVILTHADALLFREKVDIFTTSQVCSIDLTSCSTGLAHQHSEMCYCTKSSDNEKFNLHVRGPLRTSRKNIVLMAGVPGNGKISKDFSNLLQVSTIGRISAQEGEKDSKKTISPSPHTTPLVKTDDVDFWDKVQNGQLLFGQPNTCADVKSSNPRQVVVLSNGYEVVCDTVTDNGGWIVIQRRASAEVDFYRGWEDYKFGFGDVYGNFWFGLDKVHSLTYKRRYELRIDLKFKGKDYYAHYKNFTIFGEDEKYKLRINGYSGNAGDALTRRHNNYYFSTKDRDNDIADPSCAQVNHGAWWYDKCHVSNLNGKWGSTKYAEGLTWIGVTGYHDSVSFSEMKIRPLIP